jgi:peptidoglycan/LPS O-acetylase OafA/YrhL
MPHPHPLPAPRAFFPFVDVLRAVAVTLVLVYHLIVQLHWDAFPSAGVMNLFHIGWVGVELFFVISGFVITLSCVRNVEVHGARYRRPFMASRLWRIVPLYVLTSWCHLVLVAPEWLAGPARPLWTNLLLHASFLHNLSPTYAGALNGPAWSIGVEMQFYLFMALAYRWLPVRRPMWLAAGAIALGLLWRAAMAYSYSPASDLHVLMSRTQQFPGTLDAFGLGCMLALISQNAGHWAHRFTRPGWGNFALLAGLALALSTASWQVFWPRAGYWMHPGMVVGFRLLLALTFVAWLWAAITLPPVPTLTTLLRPVSYIGKISYGIYLWHMLVIVSLIRGGGGGISTAVWAVALTLAISAASWHFLEQPLMRQRRPQ